VTALLIVSIASLTAYAWGHANGTDRSATEVESAREQGWQEGYVRGFADGRADAEARRVMARTLSQRVRETAEWN
jgi:flagellar biosynthesis/type III secretory pathway protein FliH